MKGFYGGTGSAKSPAEEHLFDEKEDAMVCSEEVRKRFHSAVAKLLYLAKRARPDILTPVSYLATKVQKCDEEDMRKLDRAISYLRATSERGIIFRPGSGECESVRGCSVWGALQRKVAYGIMRGFRRRGSCSLQVRKAAYSDKVEYRG